MSKQNQILFVAGSEVGDYTHDNSSHAVMLNNRPVFDHKHRRGRSGLFYHVNDVGDYLETLTSFT